MKSTNEFSRSSSTTGATSKSLPNTMGGNASTNLYLMRHGIAVAPESTVELLLIGLARYHDRQHLLMVGHEPLLSKTIGSLLCGSHSLEIDLRKGSLCRIEIDGLPWSNPGILHWLLTPKHLRLLGTRAAKR